MAKGFVRISAGDIAAIGVFALLALAAVLRSAVGTQLDAFTVDEPWHIVAGTSYVRNGDFSLNPEHPPLAKLWVGAAMPADFKLRARTKLSEKTQERTWVEETMFDDNDARRAQSFSRVAMWTLHGLLIFALGLVVWRACGVAWAIGTLAVLAIEPTVAAHLPVVMTDLPLALTLMIAAVSAGVLASCWNLRWTVVCGLALGLALGAKHSALPGVFGIVAVLLVSVMFGWREARWRCVLERTAKLGAAGLVAIAVVWALYGFHFHAGADGSDLFNRTMADKIAELRSPYWREGLAFADRWHLLPRAYLWGLADTVRTGLEGRAISQHFIWGHIYAGAAPWFSWPAIVLSKLPLALIGLAVLGAILLYRAPLSSSAKWSLFALGAACALHLAALMSSGAVWGGARHALALIAATSMLGGAAVAMAWRMRTRTGLVAVAALFVIAFATTITTPRLWEYHNELVGGSANAYRYFDNEGIDLGQRFAEIRAFHDQVIAPSGQPMYSDYWMGEVQTRAARMHYRRRVESLDDDNVDGVYEGYFLYPMTSTLPWPSSDWDPKEVFKELRMVARFGNVAVWQGRQVRPLTRARGIYSKIEDYIYKEDGSDWTLVALRLEEVARLMPQAVHVAVELGNAYVRLGNGPKAIEAYRRVLEQHKAPVDPGIRDLLQAQIERIGASRDVTQVGLVRNPWLE